MTPGQLELVDDRGVGGVKARTFDARLPRQVGDLFWGSAGENGACRMDCGGDNDDLHAKRKKSK